MSGTAITREIKPIRNDADYAEAPAAVGGLWQAEPGAAEHDRLAMLVDDYESRRWPIEPAEPVDLIRYVMEQRGLQGSGGCARLARPGVLNRRRPLTIKMAWRLHRAFGIPAGALIKPYELIR